MITCSNCGNANPESASFCTDCGEPLARVAPSLPQPVYGEKGPGIPNSLNSAKKPGKIQFIAALCFLSGLANVFGGLIFALSILSFNLYALVQAPYCLLLGTLELIYSARLFWGKSKSIRKASGLAIMQILNFFTLNPLVLFGGSTVLGIISLFLYQDPQVRNFFNQHKLAERSQNSESSDYAY